MAKMPIEIISIGNVPRSTLQASVEIANSAQNEFLFELMPENQFADIQLHEFDEVHAEEFLDVLDDERKEARGFHPYIIAFINSFLIGDGVVNLFSFEIGQKGLSVTTIYNVPNLIIPSDRLTSYFIYYLARNTLQFITPNHENHEDTRKCVFDWKIDKTDLIKSMRPRAICDECRRLLLSGAEGMSGMQFQALDKLFEISGNILHEETKESGTEIAKPRIFIGSSSEGLPIANQIQLLLRNDAYVEVWNQGTVFSLGDATLEALEAATLTYDFGIFIFSPDDTIHSRGETKIVTRDNVIFEAGLFIGKLGRRKAFVVQPQNQQVTLPSDFNGITTASFDSEATNKAAALGPIAEIIRQAIARAKVADFA